MDTLRGRNLTPSNAANEITADSFGALDAADIQSIATVNPNGSLTNLEAANVASLSDIMTGKQMTILRGGGRPRYVPTGHLLFALDGTLHGVLFDSRRLEISGEPVELVADRGSSEFTVSEEGTLAYVSGAWEGGELVWVDRRGREESLGAPLGPYSTRGSLRTESGWRSMSAVWIATSGFGISLARPTSC